MDMRSVYDEIECAYGLITSLRNRFRDVSASGVSPESPGLLLSLLAEWASTLEIFLFDRYVEQARHLAGTRMTESSQRQVRGLRIRISAILKLVARLTELVEFVDAAHTPPNLWGLIDQTERLCRRIGRQSRVIVCPRWQHNYFYYPIDRKIKEVIAEARSSDADLSHALAIALSQYPRFFGLMYPPTQTDNALQLAVWAHEIGHFLDNLAGEEKTGGDVKAYLSQLLIQEQPLTLTDEERESLAELLQQTLGNDRGRIEYTTSAIVAWLLGRVASWAKEVFADLVSIHLLGPAALFGLWDLTRLADLDTFDNDHPPLRRRFRTLLEELASWSPDGKWKDDLPPQQLQAVDSELTALRRRLDEPEPSSRPRSATSEQERQLLTTEMRVTMRWLDAITPVIQTGVRRLVAAEDARGCYVSPSDLQGMGTAIGHLERSRPPLESGVGVGSSVIEGGSARLARCMNAGWFFWFSQRRRSGDPSDEDIRELRRRCERTSRLLLKGIELTAAQQWFAEHRSELIDPGAASSAERPPGTVSSSGEWSGVAGGVLGKEEIQRRIGDGSLFVAPLLDEDEQLGASAIDLRLANEFIAMRHPRLHALDPTDRRVGNKIADYQSSLYVPSGHAFVLHPQQFVLGSTLEYVDLPPDIAGLVIGRSSWGRLGLLVATAVKVDPEFKGVITLELVNLGNVPIFLYPFTRIAQLVLYGVCRRPWKDVPS